ncbi:MAG: Smr/MutS family protein [Saprospiraceae bacterium]|nr:Smr/MutS family protein [Saprospiraceae bacterium]MBP6695578.1 Smr/MutS family protein [Saprospiraceae bacterium]
MSLWIGDKVLLKKSGRFGIVTSIEKNGKIKVTVENTFIYTNIGNVQVIENEDYVFPDWVYLNEREKSKPLDLSRNDTIDLHIEKLDPSMENQSAAMILPFQIKKCRLFIEQNIAVKKSIMYIICGKGAGVLKQEVKAILKNEFNAKFIVEKNNGGMLEVWM